MLKHMLTTVAPSSMLNPAVTAMMNGGAHHPVARTQPDGVVMMTDLSPPGTHGGRLRGGPTPLSQHQQQLNLSMNLSQRLNQSHALNVSTLSTSKHSLGNSSGVSPGGGNPTVNNITMNGPVTQVATPPKIANGGLHISRGRTTSLSGGSTLIPANVTRFMTRSKEAGIKEMLTSLGLLCLVSLLLALLSLIFLLKISPMTTSDMRDLRRTEQLTIISADEYVVVYEVTLALCALTLSLNLCCLLVCAIQFLFAVKLVKSPQGGQR